MLAVYHTQACNPRVCMRGTGTEVDVECMGASRGLLVGFGVGLCLAILRFGPTEVVWQHAAAPTRQPLRSLEPPQPSELVAPVLRDAPAAAPTQAAAPRPPLPPIAACVGGALSLVVPGRGSSVRLGVPLGWPDVFVAGTLNGSVADEADAPRWAARARVALASIEALGPFVATSVVRQVALTLALALALALTLTLTLTRDRVRPTPHPAAAGGHLVATMRGDLVRVRVRVRVP